MMGKSANLTLLFHPGLLLTLRVYLPVRSYQSHKLLSRWLVAIDSSTGDIDQTVWMNGAVVSQQSDCKFPPNFIPRTPS